MVQAAGQFHSQLESIGAKAANLPGAVRKLGDCMLDMAEGHKDIAGHQADWVSYIYTYNNISARTCAKNYNDVGSTHPPPPPHFAI
jgi:hypothetical protein